MVTDMVKDRVAVLEQEEVAFGRFRVRPVAESPGDPTRRDVGVTPRRGCGEEADQRGAVQALWPLKPA